jgi:hypothetical protein
MESTLLEQPRSPTVMDGPFTYDSLSNLEYLQYPQSPDDIHSLLFFTQVHQPISTDWRLLTLYQGPS